MLQDLVPLISVDVGDLVTVETSSAPSTDKFDSIQIRHPEFDQCNGDEDGGTSKTGDAVDGDCWGHKGVVFYFGDGG